jgi:hypothetical protein
MVGDTARIHDLQVHCSHLPDPSLAGARRGAHLKKSYRGAEYLLGHLNLAAHLGILSHQTPTPSNMLLSSTRLGYKLIEKPTPRFQKVGSGAGLLRTICAFALLTLHTHLDQPHHEPSQPTDGAIPLSICAKCPS